MNKKILVKIPAKSKTTYPIIIGASAFDYQQWLPKTPLSRIVIITDDIVKKNYGIKLSNHLKKTNIPISLLSFPAGETAKNYKNKQKIENLMLQQQCDRHTLIIALGGGVVGDLAGFIAATFLRGIHYVQIPTTLLAMVDSSIGGKTAINTAQGKNLIGAIYQPLCVVTDLKFLKSLTKSHFINGLIETIKIFLTFDATHFNFTQKNLPKILQGDPSLLKKIISRAIKLKANIVEKDEKEQNGARSILNFGHTIGHALEKISKYQLLHGHAVAFGILVEAHIAHLLGFLPYEQLGNIQQIMAKLGFHGHYLKKFTIAKLINTTKMDKKNRDHQVHYVILKNIGTIYQAKQYTHPVPDTIVKQAIINTINSDIKHSS